MKFTKILVFYIILIFFLPGCAIAGWEYIKSMPQARYGHDATVGPNGKIYIMGGFVWYLHDGRYSNLVYDPKNDTWKVLEPVPGWVRANERLYMILDLETGFWNWVEKIEGKENYYKTFDRMTKTHKYETLVVPPERIRNTNLQRQGDGVSIVTAKDGRIYWIGGIGRWTAGFGEYIVLPYDPVAGSWPETKRERIYYSANAWRMKSNYQTNIPPMNDRRIDHEAVVTADGKICVMGGRQRERFEDSHGNVTGGDQIVLNSVECYNPESNSWEYKKPMTSNRFIFAAVVGPDDKIYTFGGSGDFASDGSWSTYNTTAVYDPETDTWSNRTPMPKPLESHAAVLAADGKIYLLGGSHGHDSPPVNDVRIYDPIEDSWEKGPGMKLPRSTLAAVATPDGKMYAIGGTDVGAYKTKEKLNVLLPRSKELYTGKVQNTVEVLDISE